MILQPSRDRDVNLDPTIPPTLASLLAGGTVGQSCTVQGWLRSLRQSKNVAFVALGDGSCLENLQVVLDPNDAEVAASLPGLSTGASLRLHGTLAESPAAGQRLELHARTIEVLGTSDPERYPLQKKGHSLEFLRGIAHLRPRSNTFGAVFRIRSRLAMATHAFFAQHDFSHVHTPIITGSDCEGAGETFDVGSRIKGNDFFGRPAMLTVSGQLNAEALAYGLGRVYTFGPTFRAENSNTVRHLSEFWMVEPEMAFFDLRQDIALAQAYLQACVAAVLRDCPEDIGFLEQHYGSGLVANLELIANGPFERVTYSEAVSILEKSGQTFERAASWGHDLQAEHERFLVEAHFQKPVIVTDYPSALKAFYMYANDDGKTVRAMDMLVPRIGEIIGGSQREHRTEQLEARLTAAGIAPESMQWYVDLGRFGAVPHAGFGLGFERLVMLCTGMTNIRDVIPFPRAPGQIAF